MKQTKFVVKLTAVVPGHLNTCSSAPRDTDLEVTETREKEFFAGVSGADPHTEIAAHDAHLLEVAACGKPWKREPQTTYGQLCPA